MRDSGHARWLWLEQKWWQEDSESWGWQWKERGRINRASPFMRRNVAVCQGQWECSDSFRQENFEIRSEFRKLMRDAMENGFRGRRLETGDPLSKEAVMLTRNRGRFKSYLGMLCDWLWLETQEEEGPKLSTKEWKIGATLSIGTFFYFYFFAKATLGPLGFCVGVSWPQWL